MTSKNLFFKLQKEDLKRRIWTIALALLVFFLSLPVFFSMTIENYYEDIFISKAENKKLLMNQILDLVSPKFPLLIIITVVAAVICGLSGFFYLQSKKKVDFYHSIPIRREVLFAINYIDGILIYFIPYVLNMILCFIILMSKNLMNIEIFTTALGTVCLNLLYFCLFYTIVIIAVMMTGNIIISCFGTAVFFLYGPMLSFIKEVYYRDFFETFYNNDYYSTIPNFLSPFGSYFNTIENIITDGMNIETVKSIVVVAIVTLLLIGIALFFMKKRPSEAAGKSMAFGISKPIIKFLLVIPLTLCGGIVFRSISNKESSSWFIFGLIFSFFIINAIIEIIYDFDIRSAFRHKKQMFSYAIIITGIVLIFQFDLVNYDSYIPKKNNVASMSVYISGLDNNDNYYDVKDGSYMGNGRYQLKYMELNNFDSAYDLVKLGIKDTDKKTDFDDLFTYNVKYTLKSGREVYRKYAIDTNKSMSLIKDIYNNTEFKKGNYLAYQIKAEDIVNLSCNNMFYYLDFSFDTKEINQLLELYREELSNLTFDELVNNTSVAVISTTQKNFTLDHYVYPSFKKTIAFLKDHGFDATKQVTVNDIVSIQVNNYNYNVSSDQDVNTLDDTNEAIDYSYDKSLKSQNYTKIEQVREIFKNLILDNYYWRNRTIINADTGLEVTVIVRKDVYGNEGQYNYYFVNDQIPDFVKEDVGYSK